MNFNLDFSILDDNWNISLPDHKKIITNAIKKVFNELKQFENKNYEISILLSNNQYIKKLNLEHRSIDKATNVLSFPMINDYSMDHENILGDIIISIDKIFSESNEQNIEVYNYLSKISVHGILHLLGYDHITDKDYYLMKQLEEKIMEKIV